MQITEVRIRKLGGQSKLLALASVTFDNVFVVHDIKILDGEKGLFVAMPSKRTNDGSYIDVAHPINSEMRRTLQDTVLAEFSKEEG